MSTSLSYEGKAREVRLRGLSKRTQLAYFAALFTLVVGVLRPHQPSFDGTAGGARGGRAARPQHHARNLWPALCQRSGCLGVGPSDAAPKGNRGCLRPAFFWLVTALGRLLSLLLIDFAITPLNLVLVGVELLAGLLALFAGLEVPKGSAARAS